ncbi:hypothetical protein ACJJI5_10055 [Microbulbifer sp. EKSA008]|uniref:hypothetical protein n=1 Tax=unclassified Microbulbifer TaxID=2619833 RepID=UPI00403A651B
MPERLASDRYSHRRDTGNDRACGPHSGDVLSRAQPHNTFRSDSGRLIPPFNNGHTNEQLVFPQRLFPTHAQESAGS